MHLNILLMCMTLICSVIFTHFYKSLAIRKAIIANTNERTLHQQPIPHGGGIVFSTLFVLAVFVLGMLHIISFEMLMVIGMGGFTATLFGFVDDATDLRASVKLIIQSILAGWVLFWLDGGVLATVEWLPVWLSWFLTWFLLVWMMNLYNFMDGVDGMAASGAVFVAMALIVVLLMTGEFSSLVLLFSLLALSCSGFLLYNWPPASIFMGDSGSVFLGYLFGSLIIKTTMTGEISIWTWIVVFGYFFAETNLTIFLRILFVKKWYHAHKSHAYQNLARVLNSHIKVTGAVQIYHFLYLLPITIWTVLTPNWAPVATIMALMPAAIITFRFGPIFSSD